MPLAALALGITTLWLATSAQPEHRRTSMGAATNGKHLRQWLRAHDPWRRRDGAVLTLVADAQELQWLADLGLHAVGGAGQVSLAVGRLRLQASLPAGPRWVNVDLVLGDAGSLPEAVQTLRIGALVLPAPLARTALRFALRAAWDPPVGGAPPLRHAIHALQWRPGQAVLRYRWRADLPQRLAGWIMPPARLARLRPYHEALIAAVRASPQAQELPALVAPLLALARERSEAGADAAAENRAALLVLAAYASGRPAAAWWPAARAWPAVPGRGLLLAGRMDFAQHYLLSAALAAEAGAPLADAMGLAKELADTRGGSGFSFNDIAVNRAGTRLGELAVRDPQRAQALLSTVRRSAELLPDVSDLPEFLGAREFEARYGGVGAPAFEAQRAEIEARIAALALFH